MGFPAIGVHVGWRGAPLRPWDRPLTSQTLLLPGAPAWMWPLFLLLHRAHRSCLNLLLGRRGEKRPLPRRVDECCSSGRPGRRVLCVCTCAFVQTQDGAGLHRQDPGRHLLSAGSVLPLGSRGPTPPGAGSEDGNQNKAGRTPHPRTAPMGPARRSRVGTARGKALQHGWATLAPSHLAWEQGERGLPGQALSTAGSLEPPPYTRSPLLHPAGLWRQPPAGRPVFGAPQTDTAQQAECKLKCKLAHAAPWQRLLSLSAALSMKQKAGVSPGTPH